MARRWSALAVLLLTTWATTRPVGAEWQGEEDQLPDWAVAGESSGGAAAVTIDGFAETLTKAGDAVGGDPLRSCEVAAVLDVEGVELAAAYGFLRQRLREILDAAEAGDEFGFLLCTGDDGDITWFIWRVEEGLPPGLGQVLAESARAEVRVPLIGAETAPDGWDVPFLAQAPVWLWIDDAGWATQQETASLAVFGASATVTATPVGSQWFLDGAPLAVCGQGDAWTPGADDAAADCAVTFTDTFEGTLSVVVTYEVSLSCVPAGLCDDVALDPIHGETSRPVRVVEAWGAVTG